MACHEFTGRLQNMCASLGFSAVPSGAGAGGRERNGVPKELSWQRADRQEAVVLLSCRVPYNPQWGEYGGYPQLFAQARTDREEESPASFIGPFLKQYRFAQEHILLARTGQGEHLVTLPAGLLPNEDRGSGLVVVLEKLAETDKTGSIRPVKTSGSLHTFLLSAGFRQILALQNFAWKTGKGSPIGRHLASDLFSFIEAGKRPVPASPIASTLLPHLSEIVAHRTPNLRAAEIHLGQMFANAVATLAADYGSAGHNALCLAGLDIDMSAALGHGEQNCFVPWKAYLARGGEALLLGQDDLFVRLMQETKH